MGRPLFVPNFVPRSVVGDLREEPRLSPLGGSGERHLRGVPTTLPPKRETAREGRFSSA
jgi:hypothetical protein